MTLDEKNKAYFRITGFLDHKELKDAFDALQSLIIGSSEFSYQDKLDELQDTYKYMLHYRMDGARDPMQETIYQNLQVSLYEMADSLRQKLSAVESPRLFYASRRNLQVIPAVSIPLLLEKLTAEYETGNLPAFEGSLSYLFASVWTSGLLSEEQADGLLAIVTAPALPAYAGCQVISALLLGLLECFDKEKLLLLLDIFRVSEDEEVQARALIAILLSLSVYQARTGLYPQIGNRLAAIAEGPGFTRAVRTITLRFILARETEKITRKLQDEIIPEMMKLSPKITRKMNLGELSMENLGDERNPDWQDILADSGLGEKMQEFGELQQEGADVMHSTFIHLKNFPFFREISHWFMPFTPEYTGFGSFRSAEEKDILQLMSGAEFMCNSDKYSLCFSMMQLPAAARKMMMGQFSGQASEMIQQGREELVSKRSRLELSAGQYIQDLYRFFKLYPRKLDFLDIFTLPLDFHNLPILKPYISDEESMTIIAEYYLRKNYFADALKIYTALAASHKDNHVLFQKIGYCKQMAGDIDGALDAYLYADLLNTESKWVIRRIAGCYRALKQPEEALEYYRRYEELSPDDLSIQISIGHCYLELKNYSEALKYYFKVDYLDSKSHRAWRPIAWCSFLTGKYDQARHYYRQIIGSQPDMQDYLNAGHTEWALQNIKGAICYYRKALSGEGNDFQKFREQFQQDIPDLIVAGIEEKEVPLMLDQLKYAVSGEA